MRNSLTAPAALPADNARDLISKEATAELLGCSARNLDRLHARGEGPPRITVSTRTVRYSRSAVLRWLATRTYTSAAAELAAEAAA